MGDLEFVAFDGKTSRRAHARGERPLLQKDVLDLTGGLS
jgi:hypothetical protein